MTSDQEAWFWVHEEERARERHNNALEYMKIEHEKRIHLMIWEAEERMRLSDSLIGVIR